MWCWFFPIANLTCPLYVMNEVWRLSDRDAPDLSVSNRIPWQLRWWWGLWILAALTGLPLLMIDDSTVAGMQSAAFWSLIRAALVIADALFACIIVAQINRRQTECYRRIRGAADATSEAKRL